MSGDSEESLEEEDLDDEYESDFVSATQSQAAVPDRCALCCNFY